MATPAYGGQTDLLQHLRSEYQNKILVLRGLYTGKHLHYDSIGIPTGTTNRGDWTIDGFLRVNEVRFSRQRLLLKAARLAVAPDYRNGFQLQFNHPAHVDIEANLGTDNPSIEQADTAMSHIFLTAQDSLSDFVPDYWKDCISEAEAGKGKNCSFSQEILAIPGVAASGQTSSAAPANDSQTTPTGDKQFRVGHGVSPPRPIMHMDPQFSDRARKARFQGTVTLGLIVTQEGLPIKIHILHPLGYGLDAQAVEAVEQWRFEPAQRDGQPVAVEIAVEVDFHLY
jgi:TonB family protein